MEEKLKPLFVEKLDEIINFDSKLFKKYNKLNKQKKEVIVYKCINNRKDENIRIQNHLGAFCNALLKNCCWDTEKVALLKSKGVP